MANFKKPRIENPAWLKKVRDMPCVLTGNPDNNDPAHIRFGHEGGMGLKPGDDLVLPLRHDLHGTQHQVGEVAFWRAYITSNDRFMMECIKAYARQLYRENNK